MPYPIQYYQLGAGDACMQFLRQSQRFEDILFTGKHQRRGANSSDALARVMFYNGGTLPGMGISWLCG